MSLENIRRYFEDTFKDNYLKDLENFLSGNVLEYTFENPWDPNDVLKVFYVGLYTHEKNLLTDGYNYDSQAVHSGIVFKTDDGIYYVLKIPAKFVGKNDYSFIEDQFSTLNIRNVLPYSGDTIEDSEWVSDSATTMWSKTDDMNSVEPKFGGLLNYESIDGLPDINDDYYPFYKNKQGELIPLKFMGKFVLPNQEVGYLFGDPNNIHGYYNEYSEYVQVMILYTKNYKPEFYENIIFKELEDIKVTDLAFIPNVSYLSKAIQSGVYLKAKWIQNEISVIDYDIYKLVVQFGSSTAGIYGDSRFNSKDANELMYGDDGEYYLGVNGDCSKAILVAQCY